LFLLVLLALATPGPALAKSGVDFDPNLGFSKYKTFVFIGGMENLVMLPVNPELINKRVHRAVTREMTAKGPREVHTNQNPDLVVYQASTSQQVNLAVMGNWGLTVLMWARIGGGCMTPCRRAALRKGP